MEKIKSQEKVTEKIKVEILEQKEKKSKHCFFNGGEIKEDKR